MSVIADKEIRPVSHGCNAVSIDTQPLASVLSAPPSFDVLPSDASARRLSSAANLPISFDPSENATLKRILDRNSRMGRREGTLLEALARAPIEDGVVHPAECAMSEMLEIDADAAAKRIEDLFYRMSPNSSSMAAGLVYLLGRQPSDLVFPWAKEVALKAMQHSSAEVRDAGLYALDTWEDLTIGQILRAFIEQEQIAWLKKYAEGMLDSLER